MKLPRHIAIIPDGNGRWAQKKHAPRMTGHKAGLQVVRKVIESCVKKKIEVLSFFAFSSENWHRPSDEVSYLMQLFIHVLRKDAKRLHEQNVRLRVIGHKNRFDLPLQKQIEKVEKLTADNSGLTLLIAANYGGQWDIVQAVQKLGADIEKGNMKPADINMESIQSH